MHTCLLNLSCAWCARSKSPPRCAWGCCASLWETGHLSSRRIRNCFWPKFEDSDLDKRKWCKEKFLPPSNSTCLSCRFFCPSASGHGTSWKLFGKTSETWRATRNVKPKLKETDYLPLAHLSVPSMVKFEKVDGLILDLAEWWNLSEMEGEVEGVREGRGTWDQGELAGGRNWF